MRELFELFVSFMYAGLMTFGGGYAMLPMLTREIVEKRHWATEEEMLDYFAISQCTPGVIAVNTATFVGYRRKKAIGAAFATFGVVVPSFVVILLIAIFLNNFMEIAWIAHAFAGIRIAVCALILSTVVKLFKNNTGTWLKVLIAAIAFVSVALLSLSPIYVVVAFFVIGALFFGRRRNA